MSNLTVYTTAPHDIFTLSQLRKYESMEHAT
jgi:hypothetical protein